MTTIHAMAKPPTEKKLVSVNGFKAPEEWYSMVKQISEERGMTIGGAIQYLVDLGKPIYEAVKKVEDGVASAATQDAIDRIKKRAG